MSPSNLWGINMFLKSDNTIDALVELSKIIQGEKDVLNSKLESQVCSKIQKLESYPVCANYKIVDNISLSSASYWFTYNSFGHGHKPITNLSSLEKRYNSIIDAIDKYENDCLGVDERNKPKIESNQIIIEKIKAFMNHIGIPSTYSVYELKSSRHRKKEHITKFAGWYDDITRLIHVSVYNSNPASKLREAVENEYKVVLAKIKKEEQEKARAELKNFYYSGGKVVGEFDSIDEIESYCKSNKLEYNRNIVEKVISNEQAIKDYSNSRFVKENEASEKWYKALREEFKNYPDKVYNLMYSQAYDQGYSSGYDEVYNYMLEISDFVDSIKEALE